MSASSLTARAWRAHKLVLPLRAARWNSSLVDIPAQKFDPPVTSHEQAQEEVRRKIFQDAVKATAPRQNWTREEISAIFYQPLLDLAYQAVRPSPVVYSG